MNILQEQSLNILDYDVLNELNKINHRTIKNRLMRELIELKKRNAYMHIEYVECENIYKNSSNEYKPIICNFNINITIILENENEIYGFEISSYYPFRAPQKFTINYKPYYNYLKINSNKTIKELNLYKGINCLCCNNLICASRWSPSTQIIMCIDEFKKYKQYRRDIINKLLSEKIINKYLLQDINLLEWLY
jgi:hypothetical protein